ncbi:hypothetical protein DDW44_16955 [Streptomyces tirandamycinicus]|uniref:Uncharacterized protein n=1 Tax=Streptomyces tirandamycinicus TaxID=2174846 RepID=A0A2S1SV37_9ACTN|nr:hypothetical protein DDW44_16955 [Streptomyces tirandamycinicus]
MAERSGDVKEACATLLDRVRRPVRRGWRGVRLGTGGIADEDPAKAGHGRRPRSPAPAPRGTLVLKRKALGPTGRDKAHRHFRAY